MARCLMLKPKIIVADEPVSMDRRVAGATSNIRSGPSAACGAHRTGEFQTIAQASWRKGTGGQLRHSGRLRKFPAQYTKVINATVRDATHVLDGLLYHESDLKIEEHGLSGREPEIRRKFGAVFVLVEGRVFDEKLFRRRETEDSYC